LTPIKERLDRGTLTRFNRNGPALVRGTRKEPTPVLRSVGREEEKKKKYRFEKAWNSIDRAGESRSYL